MLNLKVTPSSLFIPSENPAAAAAGGDDEEGGDGGDVIEMNWHCKAGMAANIDLVKEEFAKARGLRPVKIFITGPPCSGKTFFGQQLGEHYNVPHIHMEKLLSDLTSWDQEKEENYEKRQAERARMIAKIKATRAAEKEALKAKEDEQRRKRELANDDEEEPVEENAAEEENPPADGEDGNDGGDGGKAEAKPSSPPEPEEPIDVTVEGDSDDDFAVIEIKEKVKAFLKESGASRIPDHLINAAVRWRLNRNDCQNRGYVLDGYPKNAQSAADVFIITPTKPEKPKPVEGEEDPEPEEAEGEEGALKPELQTKIYPESVISLNATALFLKRRSAHLQAQQLSEGLKWHTAKLVEKLKAYNADNAIDLFNQPHPSDCACVYPTTKFFQDHKTEIFEMDADGEKYEMFESMRIYIERFGRPYNYLKSVKELNEEREKHLIEEEKATAAEQEAGSSKDQEALATQKAALEKLFEQRLTHVKAHMAELCDCDDLNMRQFLMKYIIPVLTEGMIDVWKHGPLDPVDYLAEYIFKRSNGT